MECRGCSKDLTGLEYKLVAEWPFCLQCFEQLMEKRFVEEGEPVAAGGADVEKAVGPQCPLFEREPEPGRGTTCSLCGNPIDGGETVRAGIWHLCRTCHESLTPAPVQAVAGGEQDGGEGRKPQNGPESEGPRVQVHVQADFQKSLNCGGCGRRIPAGGSVLIDGTPYCPDCFYSLSRQKAREAATDLPEESTDFSQTGEAPVDGVDSEAPGILAGERRCESCDRKTGGGDAMDVEGFTICRACYATDARLALTIARLRHLKRLRRIQAEIES